jgi:multisubunit Na+/H+ antiporter MnhG subunit
MNFTTRLLAILAVMGFVGMILLYIREFPHFFNTIGIKSLVWRAEAIGLALAACIVFINRNRFKPWNLHRPEVFSIIIAFLVFAPLLGSLSNRLLGKSSHRSFTFVAERSYIKEPYGMLKKQTVKNTYFLLEVDDRGIKRQFKSKNGPYFPITKPGELIQLPITEGFWGMDVVLIK